MREPCGRRIDAAGASSFGDLTHSGPSVEAWVREERVYPGASRLITPPGKPEGKSLSGHLQPSGRSWAPLGDQCLSPTDCYSECTPCALVVAEIVNCVLRPACVGPPHKSCDS